jgi:RNA recognition motif-containing protein
LYIHCHEHIPDGYGVEGVTDHIWFSYHNIEVSKVIVGIPDPYYDDCARGHALYVTGLSSNNTPGDVEVLFRGCGKVQYTIALIDQNSGETFRWIVMGSFEEAQKVLKERNGFRYGSRTINLSYALPPGTAIPLFGRSISQILRQQNLELLDEDIVYARARMECENNQPARCCEWFNKMISTKIALMGSDGHCAQSSFVGYVPGDASPEARKTKLFNPPTWSPTFDKYMNNRRPANIAATYDVQVEMNSKSPVVAQAMNVVEQKGEFSASPRSNGSHSGSEASTIVPSTAKVIATPLVPATPVIDQSNTVVAPIAPAPVAATTSWANIAAPSANESSNLVFNLHPEHKPNNAAPRIQAPVNPNVIAHQQGETLEEQMRTVIIFNLPQTTTLQDVSSAIAEGPILMIRFNTDSDNGNRYVGIVFQYAQDANAFREVLLQERAYSQPCRFRFIVEVGQGPPYPYDDLLEDMEPPMNGSRRLTIVKKGFFFQFTKRELRKICTSIAGPDKIQLIWVYNGGNASVVFADVKSAVAVKTKFDQMAAGKAKVGVNMVPFEGLSTTFSKDPCFAEMNLYTDIPDYNED